MLIYLHHLVTGSVEAVAILHHFFFRIKDCGNLQFIISTPFICWVSCPPWILVTVDKMFANILKLFWWKVSLHCIDR